MKAKLLPACLFSLLPAVLAAQTVRGVVVDQLDRPLVGVVVQLTDSTSRVAVRALTNDRGEFRVTAPGGGRYRLRTTRIGFRPTTTEPIALSSAAEVTRRIILPSNPIVLDPVLSVGRTTCRALGLDSTAATFAAWEQVRAALSAADMTAESREVATTTLSYERKQSLAGATVSQMGTVTTAAAAQPWHSVSADSLRRDGYVVMEQDGRTRVFRVPDLRVLGSDMFVEDHCFRISGSSDSARVGIAFEPTPSRRDMPEITGTMWLDRATSELREMRWQYINVAKQIDETATGGVMEFQRLRNGAWVISRWNIRMPIVEVGGGTDLNSITFRGVKTAGGELVSASSASGNDTLWVGPKMTLRGFAYDSLSQKALTMALVGIAGTTRSTITDSAGYFSFPDLAPGAYRLVMQHDALDAIGVPYHLTTALVTSGMDTTMVTMPSFETMWRLACESTPPGRDTALVYGTVRAVGRTKPISGAAVYATWIDIVSGSGKKRFDTTRWHLDAPTDSTGTYVLCGVPTQTGLRMRAVTDSAESGLIDILPLTNKLVERRDLTVSYEPNARGLVTGVVLGRNASPIGGARVVAEGTEEVRTDAQGKFTLRGVPLGTQQVEVIAVGLQPVARTVEVTLSDTAHLELHVTRAVVLQRVNIVASSVRQQFVAEFNSRRTKGLGIIRDSMAISMHATLNSAFMQFQGVRVDRGQIFFPRTSTNPSSPGCEPIIWIDGVHVQSTSDLMALRPTELAAVEVYLRELTVPSQFLVRNSRTPQCGAIVAWTKWYWEGNRGQGQPPT